MDAREYDRARALAEANLAKQTEPKFILAALWHMSSVLQAIGDLPEALKVEERALEHALRTLEPGDRLLVRAHSDLGRLQFTMGDAAGARPHAERALELADLAYGDSPNLVRDLDLLAVVLSALDEPDRAIALWERAIALESLEPKRLAHILHNLAHTKRENGDYEVAKPLFEQALALFEQEYGPESMNAGIALSNLAEIHRGMGHLVEAQRAAARAVRIHEALGTDHTHLGESLNNHATVLMEVGDNVGALALLERALAIFIARLGTEHPINRTVQHNIANTCQRLDMNDRAVALYEQLRIEQEKHYGPDHPQALLAIVNTGYALFDAGRHEEAKPIMLEVLDRFGGPTVKQRGVGTALRSLRNIAAAAGDFDEAIRLSEQVTALLISIYGDDNPSVTSAMAKQANILVDAGQKEAARGLAGLALGRAAVWTADTLEGTSERDAFLVVLRHGESLEAYLRAEPDPLAAWSALLQWKGAAGRVLGARRSALEVNEDPAVAEIHARLRAAREELAGAAMSRLAEEDAQSEPQALQDLRIRRDELERELADRGGRVAIRQIEPRQICEALGPREVLVDYVRMESGYRAFVVDGDCTPIHVALENALAIDGAIADWRAALSDPTAATTRIDDRGARVYDMIWAPLIDAIGAPERILLAPDMAVAGVPFSALPTDDGYLIERWDTASLDRADHLLLPPLEFHSGMLAVGDVTFGPATEASERGLPCMDQVFRPLPNTRTEIDGIANRWERRRRSELDTLTGTDATEEAWIATAPGHRILHLATHGFFAHDTCTSARASGDASIVGYDPMLLSGLVLANANSGGGLLTAAEVSRLDLRGTELVVLSACDTGLGKAVSGEGVLGLRRAFSEAGARNLVMSLWSVDDRVTAETMQDFYSHILSRRPLRVSEALREAQLARLRENRKLGEARPQDWAAFIATGVP